MEKRLPPLKRENIDFSKSYKKDNIEMVNAEILNKDSRRLSMNN